MITELLMPSLSPTMEEGTIAAWHVKPGDKVKSGQVLAEVQTDKAVVEWESIDDGVLAEIVIPAGGVAKVNMVAALLGKKAGVETAEAVKQAKAKNERLASAGAVAKSSTETTPPPPALPAEKPAVEPAAPFLGHVASPSPAPAASKPDTKPALGAKRASPVAVRMAAEAGVDVAQIPGSGPDGRVVKHDVERFLASRAAKSAAGKTVGNPFLADGRPAVQEVGLSPMRQVIGKRLLQSKQQIPHFYITESIRADKLMTLRAELNSIEGVKITVNDLILKALALTLVRHPRVNATFDGNVIRQYASADISVAVAIPDGLITPIVKSAEKLTLSQLGQTVKDLAKRAVAGKLKPEEYQGGSFTLSNLGMYGIESFGAIVNPPQAGILAVAGIKDEAVVVDGLLVPGKVLRVTLSADHRVVDGADGAAFLKDLRQLLETPSALML